LEIVVVLFSARTQTDNHLRELLLITDVEALTKESRIGDRGLPTTSTRRQNPSQREKTEARQA
jgi:hypothetical protein